MEAVVLQTKPRRDSSGLKISYDVLGSGRSAELLRQSIRRLENYPARSERKALVDVLDLISDSKLRICHTEHTEEDGVESWFFILQGS